MAKYSKSDLFNLVARREIEKVADVLFELASDKDQKVLILIKARYFEYEYRRMIMDRNLDYLDINYNYIISSIIEMIIKLVKKDEPIIINEPLKYLMFDPEKELRIKTKIEGNFYTYQVQDLFAVFNYLKSLANSNDDVNILDIVPGSIKVTFAMSEISFMKLLININNEKLKKLGVIEMELLSAQKENEVFIAPIQSNNFKITNLKTAIKSMVAKELEQGLKNLEIVILPQSPKFNELLTITSTFSKIEEKYRTGQIDASNHLSELSKITYATLGLIDSLASEDIDFDSFS